jgi:hypothetical protein
MRKAKLNPVSRGGSHWAPRGWLVCFLRCAFVVCAIHVAASPQEPASAPRLLTSEEGRVIVHAAWEHQQVLGKPDCSHLVHEIYRSAGFPYSYASSFDLYAGSDNFARVRAPQPGDLIVWPGHVGIVVDPVEHSFYSSVHTGPRAEYYNTSYWRGYGMARFYRYLLRSPGGLSVARDRPTPGTPQTRAQIITAPVIEDRPEVPSATRGGPATVTSDSNAAVLTPVVSASASSTFAVPPSIRVVNHRGKPTREEVTEAIHELSDATGNILRTDDPVRPRRPVVIFDQLQVERVEIKREHGWAHIRIDSSVSIDGGRINQKRQRKKLRWELRRTASGWVAFAPLEHAYVPRDVAVRILAGQLAQLANSHTAGSQGAAVVHQEAQLASLLSALLPNK